MKLCPQCQTQYEDASRFCTRDGTPLSDVQERRPSLEMGTVLDGRYRVVRFLGAGGMGEVYRAEHIHIVKTVAIKLLKPEITGDTEALMRFKREAILASSIGHPSIVRIEDFGQLPDGRVYMAMECLEGETLAAVCSRGPVPLAQALSWMAQTARGVAAAHDKGIVHRDLKPENVFLARQDGREVVKIVDFGIAKMRSGMTLSNHDAPSGAGAVTLTQEGRVFGTPYYMSPEQAMGIDVDFHTDIYAMGIMLYELVSGRVPFAEGSFMRVLFMQVHEPVPPLRSVCPDVPPSVEAIVHQALEKDPSRRQESAHELARQLEQAMRDLEKPDEPKEVARSDAGTPVSSVDSPLLVLSRKIHGAREVRRRRRLFWMLGFLVVLLAAGLAAGAWWMVYGRGDAEEEEEELPKKAVQKPDSDKTPRAVSFSYDCPAEMSPPMGYAPVSVGRLPGSAQKTLRLDCNGRCRIWSAPAVAHGVLVATAAPGRILAWKADTLDPLWDAAAGGDIVASPLIWGELVVTAAKDKRIRIHALSDGHQVFESPAASEYFTAAPFASGRRVLVPGWDHSFHLIEPFSLGDKVPYVPRKVAVQGMLIHAPTRLEGDRWFFAGTRILSAGRHLYTFYMPVDGRTFAVQPENKGRLCVIDSDPETVEDARVHEQCPADAIVVDTLPTLSVHPPLVTDSWAWFFLHGGPDAAPQGMVVLCSRTEGRCWRVMRAGIVSSPAAGRVRNRPFGVFAANEGGKCSLCGFFLDESSIAGTDALKCRWKTETVGCPGDLRWMGDEIVFGTDRARLFRVEASSGRILQEVRLSGRVAAAPVRCGNRLFVGTLESTLDVFEL